MLCYVMLYYIVLYHILLYRRWRSSATPSGAATRRARTTSCSGSAAGNSASQGLFIFHVCFLLYDYMSLNEFSSFYFGFSFFSKFIVFLILYFSFLVPRARWRPRAARAPAQTRRPALCRGSTWTPHAWTASRPYSWRRRAGMTDGIETPAPNPQAICKLMSLIDVSRSCIFLNGLSGVLLGGLGVPSSLLMAHIIIIIYTIITIIIIIPIIIIVIPYHYYC